MAFVKSVSSKEEFVTSAPVKFAPVKFELSKCIVVKLALVKSTSAKSTHQAVEFVIVAPTKEHS